MLIILFFIQSAFASEAQTGRSLLADSKQTDLVSADINDAADTALGAAAGVAGDEKKAEAAAKDECRKPIRCSFAIIVYLLWFALCIMGGVLSILLDLITVFQLHIFGSYLEWAREASAALFAFFDKVC